MMTAINLDDADELHPELKRYLEAAFRAHTRISSYELTAKFDDINYKFQAKQLLPVLREFYESEQFNHFKRCSSIGLRFVLGFHHRGEIKIPIDILVRLLKRLTYYEKKDPLAAAIYGKLKLDGFSENGKVYVRRYPAGAVKLLQASADQSHPLGCTYLADLLIRQAKQLSDSDNAVDQEFESDKELKIRLYREALQLLWKASGRKEGLAHTFLASMYANGVTVGDKVVVPVEYIRAHQHAKSAYALGDPKGMVVYATLLWQGVPDAGAKKDRVRAFSILLNAVDKNCELAMRYAFNYYMNGAKDDDTIIVPRNRFKAVSIAKRAAQLTNGSKMHYAKLLIKGVYDGDVCPLPPNPKEATKLLRELKRDNYPDADKLLRRLQKKRSHTQQSPEKPRVKHAKRARESEIINPAAVSHSLARHAELNQRRKVQEKGEGESLLQSSDESLKKGEGESLRQSNDEGQSLSLE